MTKPTTVAGRLLTIELGDGADPEVFTAPCGLKTKGFNGTANATETTIYDCDDPTAPADIERDINTLSREITGSGVLAKASVATWDDWFASGASKNVKVSIPGTGWFTWTGAAVLTAFNVNGPEEGKVEVEVTIQSDGEWTRETNT